MLVGLNTCSLLQVAQSFIMYLAGILLKTLEGVAFVYTLHYDVVLLSSGGGLTNSILKSAHHAI